MYSGSVAVAAVPAVFSAPLPLSVFQLQWLFVLPPAVPFKLNLALFLPVKTGIVIFSVSVS